MINRPTLLERTSAWWRRATRVPDGRTQVVPALPATPPVPAEYLSLYTYLEHRYASTVVLTFEQIEALLGFSLPAPAHTERDWWTGAPLRIDRHANAWTAARRTSIPNLSARTVTFERLP